MENISIRYAYIKNIVNKLYLTYKINNYPIDISNFLRSFDNIKVVNYSQFMYDFNLTASKTIEMLSSDEGCCTYKRSQDRYLIYLNDLEYKCDARKLWTVVHELGHIFLNHYNLLDKDKYDKDELYKFKEKEANYFTSIFLAHPLILKELNIKSSRHIEHFCGLSEEAAEYRYTSYLRNKNYGYCKGNDTIISNFKSYFEKQNGEYREYLNFMESLLIY